MPIRLGFYTHTLIKPVFKARGLMEGKIITHWAQIVGDKFAQFSLPEKITFPKGKKMEGTLHLSVTSSGALFTHYVQDLVLERINTFFGYKAVSKLRMVHGFLPPEKPPLQKSLPPLSADEKGWLDQQVEGVEDVELRDSLKKIGEQLR